MKHHTPRECTVEEFEAWSAATDRYEAVAKAADEEGGPSLSLVPTTERNQVWPTDLLPPAAAAPQDAEAPGTPPLHATPFDGIPFEDDPNLTDKRFPRNPTQSYRSREPLRIVGEVAEWEPHPPERLKDMKDVLARLEAEGDMRIID